MRRSHRRKSRKKRYSFRRRRGIARYGTGSLWGLAGKIIPSVAFIEQITGKARAAGSYNNLDMVGKAKTLANNLTGNMFGFNIFGGVPTFQQQINPSAIANKYTGIGVGSIIASLVLKKAGVKVPGAQRALSIGKKLLIPGIVGGFFDDNPNQRYNTYRAAPAPVTTVSSYQHSNWSSLQ
jgi:hypothetical protein